MKFWGGNLAEQFSQSLPALIDLEGFCSPRADNAEGNEQHEEHIYCPTDEAGTFADVAAQAKIQQAVDYCADQRAVERAHAAD